ncbi:MAG: T9SS type A sorting domain-containing protein [Bacteroidota bacterium]
MKKLFTILALSLSFFVSQAQRYKDKIFTNVTIDSVVYGNAAQYNNIAIDLKMNIYQPMGDTATNRPLLVLAHGGSFVNGTQYDADVVYLCNEFAKRGYVCISLQYRLGVNISEIILDQNQAGPQFANAVWRGTLDGRAAVRYLRAHLNTYKISAGQVYLGGVSAGGVLGLHEAFLDLPGEVGNSTPKIDTTSIGGVEGSTGSPGYSWRVKGIINLCGGLGDIEWMRNNTNLSIFSVHGTNDQTVPYKTDYFYASGIKVARLSGSFVVDSMAKALGMKSVFYTFQNAPHVPFSPGVGSAESSTAYMDTTERMLSDFLFDDIKTNGVGVKSVTANTLKLYPNPTNGKVNIEFSNNILRNIEIIDLSGKTMKELVSSQTMNSVDVSDLKQGIYFVKAYTDNGTSTQKLIIE